MTEEVVRLQQMADVNATACVPGIPYKIREGASQGVDVLMEILADERSDPEMLKLKSTVSLEFLSRAGYGPMKQIQIQQASISAHLTADDIEEIKCRARTMIDQDAEHMKE